MQVINWWGMGLIAVVALAAAVGGAWLRQPRRWKLFQRGPIDPVAEQLREVERRGNSTIWLAHIAAFLILVVFSLGSLVGLTGDALNAIVAQFRDGQGADYTAAIAIGVSTLLVFAMDIAMYYAAMRIRLLRQRRDGDGITLHVAIIGGVSVVEAASYTYMSWLYDHPANWIVWVIIIGRAICAPLLAAYLSLATPMPLGERDIRYAVEKVAGHGVITKMIVEAGASDVTLERQLALYQASTLGFPQLIDAEKATRQPALPPPAPTADTASTADGYGIWAHPTRQLTPSETTPTPPIGPITQPKSAALGKPKAGEWEELDPEPPDDGGGLPYDDDYTGEIPAIRGVSRVAEPAYTPSRNGHSARAAARDVQRRSGKARYAGMLPEDVAILRETKHDRRLKITRKMMADNPAVTANAIMSELGRHKGLSTNHRTVAGLMDEVYEQEEQARPFLLRAAGMNAQANVVTAGSTTAPLGE